MEKTESRMINLSRRQLFRWITASATGVALAESVHGLSTALAAQQSPPSLVWLNDGGSDLNLLGLLGQHVPHFQELVTLQWDLHDHGALMPTTYDPSGHIPSDAPVVVMEHLPPMEALSENAKMPTAMALKKLMEEARVAIMMGTEASYGGMETDPAQAAAFEALCRRVRTPVIKLPGVPVPPHHLVGVLAYLEFFGFPPLDAYGRPQLYYDRPVCDGCERREDLEQGRYASAFGEQGCLLRLGCKGPVTHNTCSISRWNQGENWCVGAGGPCTGCSEPGYPDHGGMGLYGALNGHRPGGTPAAWGSVERFGYGLLGLAGVGFLLQAVRRMAFPTPEDDSSRAEAEKEVR